jgi:hypothetical protein
MHGGAKMSELAENIDEEIENEEVVEIEETDTDEVELDEDGNPIEAKPVEDWMKDDTDVSKDADASDKTISLGDHIDIRTKIKKRATNAETERDALRVENEALKRGAVQTTPTPTTLQVPVYDDFDSDTEFHTAMAKYTQDLIEYNINQSTIQRTQETAVAQTKETIDTAVNEHYARADALTTDHGIKSEIFVQSEKIVRDAVETIYPKGGDAVTDRLISDLGEGSEKVMYFLGRNENALNKFKSLLISDKTGLKAAIFLGEQKSKLTNKIKPKSQAPGPANNAPGDDAIKPNVKVSKKEHDEAIDKNPQKAYEIRKAAKAKGIDTKGWLK